MNLDDATAANTDCFESQPHARREEEQHHETSITEEKKGGTEREGRAVVWDGEKGTSSYSPDGERERDIQEQRGREQLDY